MSQVLAVGCGANSQRCAAFRASPAKYWLGPAFFSLPAVTLPEGSTSTRTAILIVPLIVLREFLEMSGRTRWTTSPCDASAALGAALRPRTAGLGFGASAVCGGVGGADCPLTGAVGVVPVFPEDPPREKNTTRATSNAIMRTAA